MSITYEVTSYDITLEQAIQIVKNIVSGDEHESNVILREQAMAMVLVYVLGAFPYRTAENDAPDVIATLKSAM